ncbi:UNVERIFIED_CONTAM: hypothetical protein HDU68_001879 [Siphonaria sp. JEL0065]|nr:hypothetical protein HDU68_001879 [Siphonaria sp. JEL0065]
MELHRPNSPYWKKKTTSGGDSKPKGIPIRMPTARKDDDDLETLLADMNVLNIGSKKTTQGYRRPIVIDSDSSESEESEEEEEPLEVDGLKVNLLPHQVKGVKWLIAKEQLGNGGCILADDMGLGKTVQIIALMLAANPKSIACKTTLIIAPVSLLNQWKSEITSKTATGSLSVLIHHGKTRAMTAAELMRYDVVLTTYGLVTSSFKEDGSSGKGGIAHEVIKLDESDDEVAGGALMQAKFFRIVLDEAHTIKNPKSKGSKACALLQAEKRVCMTGDFFVLQYCSPITNTEVKHTGTPIHNNIDELYSLIRFLRIPMYEKLNDFKRITKNNHHLQTLLSATMLRRTKKGLALDSIQIESAAKAAELSGSSSKIAVEPTKPSNAFTINLPEKTIINCRVQLSGDELRYYKEVEERGQDKIKDAQNADSLNRMVVLSLLLRLRQICNHRLLPFLSSKEQSLEFLTSTSVQSQPQADEVDDLDSLDDLVSKMTINGGTVDDSPRPWEKRRVLPAFKKAPGSTNESNQKPTRVIDLTLDSPKKEEYVSTQQPISLPTCRSCGLTLFEQREDSLCEDCCSVVVVDNDDLPPVTGNSSSKVNKMLDIIKTRLKEAPKEKFIVFSQWTSTFKVLDKALKEEKIKFIQYDGKMSSTAKADALQLFENDKSVSVCLMSLMCGAVGLNLTCANNVILMDLWWNPMLEDQAIDRVYRIGQKKPVFVHRMIVADSVEERIVLLQNKKRQLVETTIGGKEGFKPKNLSIGELVALFGVKA